MDVTGIPTTTTKVTILISFILCIDNHVIVEGCDQDMNPVTVEGEELMARALCHELDHLDGRLYIDTMERELVGEELEQYRQGSLDEESEEEAE